MSRLLSQCLNEFMFKYLCEFTCLQCCPSFMRSICLHCCLNVMMLCYEEFIFTVLSQSLNCEFIFTLLSQCFLESSCSQCCPNVFVRSSCAHWYLNVLVRSLCSQCYPNLFGVHVHSAAPVSL